MGLLFLLVCLFILYFNKTVYSSRKYAVLFAMAVYIVVTLMDFAWLCEIGRPFHLTDPSDYYYNTVNASFYDVLKSGGSNLFYGIVNWCYNHIYDSPYTISLFVKFDNVLVVLIAYLLLTHRAKGFGVNDMILLFNPYLVVTITRNVRDAYIILFVSMVLIGLGSIYDSKFKRYYLVLGLIMLALTRSILLIVFAIIFFVSLIKKKDKWLYVLVPCVIGVIALSFNQIISSIIYQSISAMEFVGEDTSELAGLIDNPYSLSSLITLFQRFVIGFFALIFTPHPVNYYHQWVVNSDMFGNAGIYTAFDSVLIILGAIYCYIFILPRFFRYFVKYKENLTGIFYFVSFFIIIYVMAYLGITDIRNRHIIFFFIMIDYILRRKKFSFSENKVYYLLSLIMFILIQS